MVQGVVVAQVETAAVHQISERRDLSVLASLDHGWGISRRGIVLGKDTSQLFSGASKAFIVATYQDVLGRGDSHTAEQESQSGLHGGLIWFGYLQ